MIMLEAKVEGVLLQDRKGTLKRHRGCELVHHGRWQATGNDERLCLKTFSDKVNVSENGFYCERFVHIPVTAIYTACWMCSNDKCD